MRFRVAQSQFSLSSFAELACNYLWKEAKLGKLCFARDLAKCGFATSDLQNFSPL